MHAAIANQLALALDGYAAAVQLSAAAQHNVAAIANKSSAIVLNVDVLYRQRAVRIQCAAEIISVSIEIIQRQRAVVHSKGRALSRSYTSPIKLNISAILSVDNSQHGVVGSAVLQTVFFNILLYCFSLIRISCKKFFHFRQECVQNGRSAAFVDAPSTICIYFCSIRTIVAECKSSIIILYIISSGINVSPIIKIDACSPIQPIVVVVLTSIRQSCKHTIILRRNIINTTNC